MIPKLKYGDKIHIKSRQGIYTFVKKDKYRMYITSKIWSYDKDPIRCTVINDFKCFAGGHWNFKK